MNLLLDSHTFIWIHKEPHKLSVEVIINPANQLFLSVVTAWELQIKIALGKFSFNDSLENVIHQEQLSNGLQILPVKLSHALFIENLPFHHKDPFDRMLISQAITENMTLVSADAKFADYQADLLW